MLARDATQAEAILLDALRADSFHGPAHNNLGVIYLNRGDLYEAARSFDSARTLMPGHPDPRLNMGLALEQGGRVGEAIGAYESALEVQPDYFPAILAITRAQLRHGHADERTRNFLRQIMMRGSEEWRLWARERLYALGLE